MSNLFENNQVQHVETSPSSGETVVILPKPSEGQHYEFESLPDGRIRIFVAEK